MRLSDTNGRSIGFLDGASVRDENGKVTHERSSDDGEEYRLARVAAHCMTGRVSAKHRPSMAAVVACKDAEERKVLLDLSPTDVGTASARDGLLGLAQNDSGCIADSVSGVRLVDRMQGYVWTESPSDAISSVEPNLVSAGGGQSVNPNFAKIAFDTKSCSLSARLPRGTVANADFALKAQVTRYLIELLRLAREIRVANLLLTSGNWDSGNATAAAAKWNGGAGANPLADLFTALGKSFLPSNVLVMPENAAQYFYTTTIRDYVQAGGPLPTVLVARARYLNSGALQYVWAPPVPTNVALVRAPVEEHRIPTSTTLRWLGDENIDQGERVDGFFVRSFREQQGGMFGSDVIVVVHNDAEIQIQTATKKCQVGALITGALA